MKGSSGSESSSEGGSAARPPSATYQYVLLVTPDASRRQAARPSASYSYVEIRVGSARAGSPSPGSSVAIGCVLQGSGHGGLPAHTAGPGSSCVPYSCLFFLLFLSNAATSLFFPRERLLSATAPFRRLPHLSFWQANLAPIYSHKVRYRSRRLAAATSASHLCH